MHQREPVLTGSPAPDGDAPGRRRGPRRAVVITVAVCAALVAVVIAVDATSHNGPGHGTSGPAARPLAPALTLPSLGDSAQQVSLSAYRGRPLIVNFFASWCAPCKKETPLLASFYRASGDSVPVIGVDADDTAPAARQFVAAEGVTYPVGFESTSALADAYGVSEIGIPETFFLDAGHHIAKRVLGGVTAKELARDTAMIEPAARKARA